MADDHNFQPKLGKIRSQSALHGRKYLHRVLKAAALAGGMRHGARRGHFHGSQIGRGASIGRVLGAWGRFATYRSRRVIVKFRIAKLTGKGLDGARAHMRYIQRDGVTREGEPGQLYDAKNDRSDGRAFCDRAVGDERQFRFIVSAEDGTEYDDLKTMTRRLMAQMEQDLGTRLDWSAVDHYNTGHPHTHIIVRGKTDRGDDLIIAREYLTHGMRERAAELVTLDLGACSDLEIENRLRREVEQERFTSLDRDLLRAADEERVVLATGRDAFSQSLRAGRLQKLGRLGLADEIAPGRWRLDEGLEETLRRMGERGDILKTMYREMTGMGLARAPADYVIYDPSGAKARPVLGRLVTRGLSDELADRHYIIVDGVDGRSHYIDIGRADATALVPENSIVRIAPRPVELRAADRVIAEVAAAHGGRYSVDLHLRHDPSASADFAEAHVRRLEAMRKIAKSVIRELDGTWIIAPDHLDRALAYERMRVKEMPVMVQTLSTLPLERQIGCDGATWLDRELLADAPVPLRDAGFGREAREALDQRRRWLIEQDLARQEQDRILYRANMLGLLRRRELTRVAGQLSSELGLAYAEAWQSERIEGIYRRSLDLASGRFALIEKSREFTLVPWRPVLERNLSREVSGIVRGDSISWMIGRQRSGPSIS